ncbi:HA1F protein, partial [Piaya cayana]|nr:HA1F protein [Piaya cayana]
SLRYFQVAVTEPSLGVPEFVIVGYVDGNLIMRYDSGSRRMEPQAQWMKDKLDQQHWDTQTEIAQGYQEKNRLYLGTL